MASRSWGDVVPQQVARKTGGYDCKFVDTPPDKLVCQICLYVARSPHQVTCCGKVYCKACLDEHKKHSNICPNCRKREQDFADIKGELEIRSLKVMCQNRCGWVGELRSLEDHLRICVYALLRCPNKCMNNKKVVQISRRNLDRHLMKRCPNRQYQCPYCKVTGKYCHITTTHLDTCRMLKIPCPNCKVIVPRCKLSDHLATCEYAVLHRTDKYVENTKEVQMLHHDWAGWGHLAGSSGSHASTGWGNLLFPQQMLSHAPCKMGGYDCKFVDTPPDNLVCQICLLVASAPHQMTCCGRVYCKTCLDEHKKHFRSCPNCGKRGQNFPDIRREQEIQSLRVKCNNCENGCDWVGELRSLDDHLITCGYTLLHCPNKCTDNKKEVQILHHDLDHHLMKKCPNRQYQCPHCKTTGRYCDITTTHLCSVENVGKQQHKISELQKEMTVMGDNLLDHQGCPCVFKMAEFTRHKSFKQEWYSPPFYTHLGGYKMRLRVDANGDGDTRVSVYIYLMQGKNDNNLLWPFTGEVTITLLNQLEEKNHHTCTISFPQDMEANGERAGFPGFISHHKLGYGSVMNCQFLKEDCLHFRIEVKASINVAVQTHAEATATKITGYLRGVNVIAETSVLVTNEAQTFNWKGYGLKLHIPPGTLPADLEECRLLMKVGLSGQFELPDNASLVSAVYWIDTEPRCKFSQHLTMEIQHCVKLTLTSKLSFVHARCSQKHLPYAFEAKDGGVFSTESAYGCVQLTHFSILSVIYKMLVPGVQLYSASVYYLRKGVNRIDIHFAITKNLEAHATVVEQKYSAKGATFETEMRLEFESDCILLQLPSEEEIIDGGWRIVPLCHPGITKEQVDSFTPSRGIPSCQLTAEWTGQGRPSRLSHKVTLMGAKEPSNFFRVVIDYDSNLPERIRQLSTSSEASECIQAPVPDMRDLMDALYHTVADKWKHTGIYLHLPMATLNAIATEHQNNPHNCLIKMLEVWLKRVDPPPTWSAIIKTVEFLGEMQLGRELREKYCQQT